MAGVNPTDYLQFRDMNLPLCLIHYFILLTLARLVWGLHQPSPEKFLRIDDPWFDHLDRKGLFQQQMEVAAGVTYDANIPHTRWMTLVVTVFAHSSGSVLVVRQIFSSKYGQSQVFIRPHLKVTPRFTYVDAVACVARELI